MKFKESPEGIIEAKKWLLKENLLNSCGPSDASGIVFIKCANNLYKEMECSPYYTFSEIRCILKDYKDLLIEGELIIDDLDILDDLLGDLVSQFTQVITDLDKNCSPCY